MFKNIIFLLAFILAAIALTYNLSVLHQWHHETAIDESTSQESNKN